MFSKEIIEASIKYYDLHNDLSSNDRIKNISIIFGIKASAFYEHYKNNKNGIQTKERKKRESTITPEILDYIKETINSTKTICVKKMIEKIDTKYDVSISTSYFYDILEQLNYSHKKVYIKHCPYEAEDFEDRKKEFFEKITKLDINSIVSIDETAIYLDSHGNYGWALKGQKCELISRNGNLYKKRFSLLMAISNKRVMLYGLFKGSINGEIFLNFIQELIDEYDNQYTLLVDNATIHHTKILTSYVKDKNISIVYNIPYNPETNPIEMCFSPIKVKVRLTLNPMIRLLSEKYIILWMIILIRLRQIH